MAVNATHSTFFNSGSISFRALKDNFGGPGNNIKLSTYTKKTSLNNGSPIVPDATENADIPTTNSNISLSHYRGSIKKYVLTQSGTDQNITYNSGWNNNLGKNVVKIFKVTGDVGSTSTSQYALKFTSTGYNLELQITGSGRVIGARGTGGAANGGKGTNGGPALRINNGASKSFNTGYSHARINGKVIAGGGGGTAGNIGATKNANCNFNSSNNANGARNKQSSRTGCRSLRCSSTSSSRGITGNKSGGPNCNYNNVSSERKNRRRRRRRFWGGRKGRSRNRKEEKGRGCHGRARTNDCVTSVRGNCNYNHRYNISANGGNGGNGGNGAGWSGGSFHNKNAGNFGSSGNTSNCDRGGSGSVTGGQGNKGFGGGQKGQSGGGSKGGRGGIAIAGNRISFNGSQWNNIYGNLLDL